MRGYVFLSRDAIALQDRFPVNFSDLHSNSSHIVLRVFESDGGQSQLRIDPLDAYASDKMVFMLNNHAGFASPTGLPELGPYLFVGVPGPSRYPYHHDHIETESGFKANGMNYSRLCINTQFHHFVQFPNRFDSSTEPTGNEEAFLSGWLNTRETMAPDNAINSVEDFQSVVGLQFGNETCGLHMIMQNWTGFHNITGVAIGLPFGKTSGANIRQVMQLLLNLSGYLMV